MNYDFNNNFILRFEFFGGLLHSIEDATEFELDFENTVFLKCIQLGYKFDDSVLFTSKYFNKKYFPCLDDFIGENILILNKKNSKKKEINFIYLKKYIDNFINEVSNKKNLSFPIQASLYLNSSCQLNCKFCFFQDKRKIYSKIRSYEDWIKLIKAMKEYGIIYISILGGEPTLYNGIDNILLFLEKESIKTTITTNAINIKDSTMDIICNSKYITPTISLESLDVDLNSYLMGVDPNNALKTINRLLKRNKIPRINGVYTNQKDEDIYKMIDFCVNNKITEYYLSYFIDLTNNFELKKHSILDMRKLRERVLNYIYLKGYDDKINFQVQGCLLYSAYEDDKSICIDSKYEKIKYGCEAGNTKIEIMPDGSVLPCVLFGNEDFDYKNAFDEDIKSIWNSADYLIKLREFKCINNVCLKCKFYDFCNGGCPALKLKNKQSIIKDGDDRCHILKGEKR